MGRKTAYELRLQAAAEKRAAAKAVELDVDATVSQLRCARRPAARKAPKATTKIVVRRPTGGRRTAPPSRPIAEGTTNLAPDGEILFDPMLSVDQVAMWLQKPKSTLYKWRSIGAGPRAFKVGCDLRYRRSDVEAFIESCATSAADRRSA